MKVFLLITTLLITQAFLTGCGGGTGMSEDQEDQVCIIQHEISMFHPKNQAALEHLEKAIAAVSAAKDYYYYNSQFESNIQTAKAELYFAETENQK